MLYNTTTNSNEMREEISRRLEGGSSSESLGRRRLDREKVS